MDQSCSYSCLSGIQAQPLVITGFWFLLSEVPGLIMHILGEYPRGENGLMYMSVVKSVFMCLYPKLFPLSNVFFGE